MTLENQWQLFILQGLDIDMLTHGSLFSGIGGFDLAAEWMGWQNAFHCEINEFCTIILNYHFPNAEHYTDITKTDFSKWRGCIDVLSGGFPCQPFSVAGQRKGADDDRYLWPEMLRAIREIKPTWVVGENVGGIVTMVQPGKTLELGRSTSLFGEDYKDEEIHQQFVVETVCTDLEREGYSVQPILIPACAVGAPHRRDRVWFIANRTDTGAESLQRTGQDGIHAVGTVTNTESQQSEWHRPEQPKIGSTEQGKLGRSDSETDSKRSASYPYGKCTQGRNDITSQEWEIKGRRKTGQLRIIPNWDIFPTQPPVCRGNDGLPFDVDDLTISFAQWRKESVKAYGNAIVPQVAYEIFKAIQETYNK